MTSNESTRRVLPGVPPNHVASGQARQDAVVMPVWTPIRLLNSQRLL